MLGHLSVSRERFLAFARKLALVTTCGVPLAACGGASGGTAPPPLPLVKVSATTSPPPATPSDETMPMPMPIDGPCRCSWDANQSKAPRVCKRGEENYEGVACIPRAPSFE